MVFKLISLFLFLVIKNVYCRRAEPTIGEKWKEMKDLSYRSHLISFNNDLFKRHIRGSARNYTVIAMFTALDSRRGCGVCGEANEEFSILASSYRYSKYYPGDIFFVVLDFDKAPDAFKVLDINIAPLFIRFPPRGNYKKSDVMDTQRTGISAEIISKWVESLTGVQVIVLRPPNYAGTVGLLMLVSLFGFLLYIRRNNLEFLYNKTMWAVVALIFSFVMSSGHMWNHIRGPPFMRKTREGAVSYIAGSSQSQYLVESYIVMGISGMAVTGLILMTEAARGKSDLKLRKFMAILGITLYAFFFSLMLSIFRAKSGGYPYSFLIG